MPKSERKFEETRKKNDSEDISFSSITFKSGAWACYLTSGCVTSLLLGRFGEGFPETHQLWGFVHLGMKQLAPGAIGVRVSGNLDGGLFR